MVRALNPMRACRIVWLEKSSGSVTKRFGAGRHERASILRNMDTRSRGTIRCPFGSIDGSTSCAQRLMHTSRTLVSPSREVSRDENRTSEGRSCRSGANTARFSHLGLGRSIRLSRPEDGNMCRVAPGTGHDHRHLCEAVRRAKVRPRVG